jgi:hypothetical protein
VRAHKVGRLLSDKSTGIFAIACPFPSEFARRGQSDSNVAYHNAWEHIDWSGAELAWECRAPPARARALKLTR